MNIIVTMPDPNKEGYRELINFFKRMKRCKKYNGTLIYFRVGNLPRESVIGSRCLIVSNGVLIGSHKIVGSRFVSNDESKALSHGNWGEGDYIIRDASTWEEAKDKIQITGFRGWRYFNNLLKKKVEDGKES